MRLNNTEKSFFIQINYALLVDENYFYQSMPTTNLSGITKASQLKTITILLKTEKIKSLKK